MSIPMYAADVSNVQKNVYVYDKEGTLQAEVKEKIRRTLVEFEVQTDINVIVATFSKEGGVQAREVLNKLSQNGEYTVILFSISEKVVVCSDSSIYTIPELKSLMQAQNREECNQVVEEATMSILQKIARKENRTFTIKKESVSFSELFNREDLQKLSHLTLIAIIVVMIVLIVPAITVYILILCIRELCKTFFGSRFD